MKISLKEVETIHLKFEEKACMRLKWCQPLIYASQIATSLKLNFHELESWTMPRMKCLNELATCKEQLALCTNIECICYQLLGQVHVPLAWQNKKCSTIYSTLFIFLPNDLKSRKNKLIQGCNYCQILVAYVTYRINSSVVPIMTFKKYIYIYIYQ